MFSPTSDPPFLNFIYLFIHVVVVGIRPILILTLTLILILVLILILILILVLIRQTWCQIFFTHSLPIPACVGSGSRSSRVSSLIHKLGVAVSFLFQPFRSHTWEHLFNLALQVWLLLGRNENLQKCSRTEGRRIKMTGLSSINKKCICW